MDLIKKQIKEKIESTLDATDVVVEEPKKGVADLAIPLFAFSKLWKTSSQNVYGKIEPILKDDHRIKTIEFSNGFLNIYLKRVDLSNHILKDIVAKDHMYGSEKLEDDAVICMDFSSPNIAKSFSVGHLRSTMIGNALRNIYQKLGYKTIAINHLGDWGTQFGKMIVAYQKWGDEEKVKANPIIELQKLYVRFHKEEEKDSVLEQAGRNAFLKLEKGDLDYVKLWTWFKDESLREFMEMYDLLGVDFDAYDGESFYNDKMDAIVDELSEKNLLRIDEGATIVDLEAGMPPALIKKSDGATLYITRDIAALLYRNKTYQFKKMLYVVGNEQRLHFEQLKKVTDLMGYDFDIIHINFGLVLVDGKKMSTRSGKFTRLEDVLKEAIRLAKDAISLKNPNLKDKDGVARAVGVGAIIFNDLKNERHLDVDFNLENMVRFEGQTGPYLQYSGVRIASILREHAYDSAKVDASHYAEDHYFEIVKQLSQFPIILKKSMEVNAPNLIARYILSLAQAFNSFYGKQRIVMDDIGHKQANLLFVKAIQIVLNEGLRMLGMIPLQEM
ncbi:MAG: arginine--tRNA ligase [Acholeplasmataceae bacterium]|nr:arginine--tRNA ligase [Acholeplasmataceae bacterium]